MTLARLFPRREAVAIVCEVHVAECARPGVPTVRLPPLGASFTGLLNAFGLELWEDAAGRPYLVEEGAFDAAVLTDIPDRLESPRHARG